MDNHHDEKLTLPRRIELLTNQGGISNIRGTIKYHGAVDGTDGVWYGIEWDDSSRGKHSGDKDGKQYFTARTPLSATFVRPSKRIHLGQSLLSAFKHKYGYSDEELEFAPNIAGISKKLSQTRELRVAGLEHMGVYGVSDSEAEELASEAYNLRQLSLAHSLISSFADVDKLVKSLPSLQELDISSNIFQIQAESYRSLGQLKTLKLNNTLIEWREIASLSDSLTALEELELAYNGIASLESTSAMSTLQTLVVAHNKIADWNEVQALLKSMPRLHTLNLDSNSIASIPYSAADAHSLKTLILSHNEIADWKSIDALALSLPNVESLSLTDCALMNNEADIGKARRNVIARFANLRTLNLSEVSIEERKDAEWSYIKSPPTEQDPKRARYTELCKEYDYEPSNQPTKKQTYLQLKKIDIELRLDSKTYPLTTISSMPIKKLRMIARRVFDLSQLDVSLTASMIPPPNMFGEVTQERTDVELDDDYKDLRWFSVESGDHIVVRPK